MPGAPRPPSRRTPMLNACVLLGLLVSVTLGVVVPPAPALSSNVFFAGTALAVPGTMVALLGVIIGTPVAAAFGFPGGIGAGVALWVLRTRDVIEDADPGDGRDDGYGGGGPGPDPGDEPRPPEGPLVDWEAFEREAHAAYAARRSDADRLAGVS